MRHVYSPSRARLLRSLGGLGALAMTTCWAPAVIGQAPLSLVLAHGAAEDSPRHLAALNFAELVAQATGRRIRISVSPAGLSGDDPTLLEKMRLGQIAMTANSQGATASIVPEFAALGMPYLFSSEFEVWAMLSGPVGAELAKRAETKGFVTLGCWDNGFRQITNTKRPIRKPEDLAGLVIRTPKDSVTVDFLSSMGATPKEVPFSDLKTALANRTVDGQENPLINIYTAGLHEVQAFLSLTNHKYECTPLLMSSLVWELLSAGDRAHIRKVAAEATAYQRDLMRKSDERALNRLRGSDIKVNSIFDFDAFARKSEPVVSKWSQGEIGPFVQQVFETVAKRRGNSTHGGNSRKP